MGSDFFNNKKVVVKKLLIDGAFMHDIEQMYAIWLIVKDSFL